MPISSFMGLETSLRGLLAQQRALDVTTHNIANADRTGYTRQEAVMTAALAQLQALAGDNPADNPYYAPIRNLLAWEIERARGLYAKAAAGIELVHRTSQDCLRTAHTLYSGILDEIERTDYDVFSRRVQVPLARRASVGLTGLRGALTARRGGPARPTG